MSKLSGETPDDMYKINPEFDSIIEAVQARPLITTYAIEHDGERVLQPTRQPEDYFLGADVLVSDVVDAIHKTIHKSRFENFMIKSRLTGWEPDTTMPGESDGEE